MTESKLNFERNENKLQFPSAEVLLSKIRKSVMVEFDQLIHPQNYYYQICHAIGDKSLGVYDFYHKLFNIPHIYHNLELENPNVISQIITILCEGSVPYVASADNNEVTSLELVKRYQEQVLGLVKTRFASRK